MKKVLEKMLCGSLIIANSFLPLNAGNYFEVGSGKIRELWYDVGVEYDDGFVHEKKELGFDETFLFRNYDFNDFVKKTMVGCSKSNEYSLNCYMNASCDENEFLFFYGNSGFSNLSEVEKKNMGFSNACFSESLNGVKLYLFLPEGVGVKENNQLVAGRDCSNGDLRLYDCIAGEDSPVYEGVHKLNDYLEVYVGEDGVESIIEGISQRDFSKVKNGIKNIGSDPVGASLKWLEGKVEDNFEYVDMDGEYISLLRKIPGKFGSILSGAICLSGSIEEIAERGRRKELEEIIEGDYNVHQIPLYINEKDIYGNIYVGRVLYFSFNEEEERRKGYFIVSELGFNSINNEKAKMSDIVFEFEF